MESKSIALPFSQSKLWSDTGIEPVVLVVLYQLSYYMFYNIRQESNLRLQHVMFRNLSESIRLTKGAALWDVQVLTWFRFSYTTSFLWEAFFITGFVMMQFIICLPEIKNPAAGPGQVNDE